MGESPAAPAGWKEVSGVYQGKPSVSQASGWESPDQVSSDVSEDSVLGNTWPRLPFHTLKRPCSTPGPPGIAPELRATCVALPLRSCPADKEEVLESQPGAGHQRATTFPGGGLGQSEGIAPGSCLQVTVHRQPRSLHPSPEAQQLGSLATC